MWEDCEDRMVKEVFASSGPKWNGPYGHRLAELSRKYLLKRARRYRIWCDPSLDEEDLAQKCLEKLFAFTEKDGRLEDEDCLKYKAFLNAILRNLFIDTIRAAKRSRRNLHVPYESDDAHPEASTRRAFTSPLDKSLVGQLHLKVMERMRNESPRHAEALEMQMAGREYRDMAERLSTTIDNAYHLVHRGHKLYEKILTELSEPPTDVV